MNDDETWIEGEHANTLNRFDVGDVRTTHLVTQSSVAQTLDAHYYKGPGSRQGGEREYIACVEVASTLQRGGGGPRGQRNDAEGAGGGHLIPQTFSVYPEGGNGADIAATQVDCSPALTQVKSERGVHVVQNQAGAFKAGQGAAAGSIGYEDEMSPTLTSSPSGSNQVPTLHQQMSVRRLIPVECERLMGLPDGWTAPSGVKAPDSKRYAACGDAIVTNVAFWIADRIRMIEEEENA